MNTNVKVIGLTRLGIKPKSTALEADVLTTRLSELLMPAMPTSLHLSSLLKPKIKKLTQSCDVMGALVSFYKSNPASAQYC